MQLSSSSSLILPVPHLAADMWCLLHLDTFPPGNTAQICCRCLLLPLCGMFFTQQGLACIC